MLTVITILITMEWWWHD